jgi:hypothetical protein
MRLVYGAVSVADWRLGRLVHHVWLTNAYALRDRDRRCLCSLSVLSTSRSCEVAAESDRRSVVVVAVLVVGVEEREEEL